jgi:hypothetical protein
LVLEAIGDDKVRVNHQSLDSPLVIMDNQALEVVAVCKQWHVGGAPRAAEYINIDPIGFSEAGYGPETKSR